MTALYMMVMDSDFILKISRLSSSLEVWSLCAVVSALMMKVNASLISGNFRQIKTVKSLTEVFIKEFEKVFYKVFMKYKYKVFIKFL